MTIVSVSKVSIEFGGEALFSDVTFSIFDRDRLAIIGPNGSGKSTLLKIVAGLLEPDDGCVTSITGTRICYVPQQAAATGALTIEECLRQQVEIPENETLPGELLRITGQAGFTDLSVPVSSLSGGWLKRLSLVAAFSKPADVYLLDEPTNHLDVEGVWWLEDFIAGHSAAIVVCSHDRYFLQSVTTRTLEVNAIFPTGVFSTDGAYRQFLERRQIFLEAEGQRQSKLKNIVRRESEWAGRQPKARGTKARARLDAAEQLQQELQEVRGRLAVKESNIEFSGTGKKSRRLVEVERVSKRFGENVVLQDVSFVLTPGSKATLLGTNGSGKSTLLKLLHGSLEPDSGTVKKVQGLVISYFDQSRSLLDDSATLRRTFAPDSDSVIYNGNAVHISSWAQRFGFSYEDLDRPLSRFSGGEKARAYIGCLMLQAADVLLLDEPTNDLDIETLELLETAIKGSDKAFVIVSHDRFFLEEICTDYYAINSAGALEKFGGVTQWERSRREKTTGLSVSKKTTDSQKAASVRKPGKLSYNEQREYRSIENSIEKAETRVAELEALLRSEAVTTDSERLLAITADLSAAVTRVEELYTRWEELEQIKAGLL